MKGRRPAGGVKQNEKQDGKKKSKAALSHAMAHKPVETKKLASALAAHLQSLYKGEGVLVVEDDKRIIFYCTLCEVWAYHDASLVDHLHGKKHKRKQGEATPLTSPPSSVTGSPPWEKTSKLTPPWKLVGEGKGSAVSSSSKRKAAHPTDASKTSSGGSKRQRIANEQAASSIPGSVADALAIVPAAEEEPEEPSRPEDFALALFKFTNLIGRRGKWEKQLLKCSDSGPGDKHDQGEELPLLADIPTERADEPKKQVQGASSKDNIPRDGVEGDKEKEPEGMVPELGCTEKPAELNAGMDVECGACDGNDSTAVPGPGEAASGRAEDDAAGNAPAAPVPERAAEADASEDVSPPAAVSAAVPAKRRKGVSGAGTGARVCFLCQLPMVEGQVVGALWNARLKRFACSSRNRHKKFHIFHSHCIADWVVFCSAIANTRVPPALCCPLEADVAHLLTSMHHHHKAHAASLGPSRLTSAATADAAAAGKVTGAAAAAGGNAPVSASAAVGTTGNGMQGEAPAASGAGMNGADADASSASSEELHSDAWAWAGIPDALHSSATAAAVASSALAAAAATGPVSSEDAAVVAIVATAAASAAASLTAPPRPSVNAAAALHTHGTRTSPDAVSLEPSKEKSSAPAAAPGAAAAVNKAVSDNRAESDSVVPAGPAAPAAAAEGAEALEGAKLLPLTEVFCPECQGTGRYGPQDSLEHPRYRLAQVFDWIVAMMIAQKAGMARGGEEEGDGAGGKADVSMKAGSPEGDEGAPDIREGVEGSAGRKAEMALGAEGKATAAEVAHPSPPTSHTCAAHCTVGNGEISIGKEAGMQDMGAGSSRCAGADGVKVDGLVESAAVKSSDEGAAAGVAAARLHFADHTVQKAADVAFRGLRVLSAEFLSAHMGKGKHLGTPTGSNKHA